MFTLERFIGVFSGNFLLGVILVSFFVVIRTLVFFGLTNILRLFKGRSRVLADTGVLSCVWLNAILTFPLHVTALV